MLRCSTIRTGASKCDAGDSPTPFSQLIACKPNLKLTHVSRDASSPRYIVKVTVTGKGMTPDSRGETGIWIRNYEEVSTAPAAPIKVRWGSHAWVAGE